MCGIGGIMRMGSRPIKAWQIKMLANGLQYRGNDATGIAAIWNDGHTSWVKHHEPAWKFTASRDFEDWADKHLGDPELRTVLVHTRKATKGTPYKNDNNHPLQMGEGLIVHNGMISNDDALFSQKKWKRSAETDSDIIRAILDDHGGIDVALIEKMGQLQGFAAVAAIHPATPDKLLLLRDSNPLMVGAVDDYIAFASDKKVLHQILKPWVRRFGIVMQVHAPDISFVPMANESGWIIGPGGLEAHAKFACNGLRGRGNTSYSITSSDYHERQERFKREATERTLDTTVVPRHNHNASAFINGGLPNYVICPNYTCNKHVSLSELQRRLPLDRLSCQACSTSLANAVSAPVN